ncbi:hypothetical protein A4A49_06638 [Nicotiana attenuata]|uniref:Uncharacterized protein n=1 Tax=Nicotiana attenuata TaxID=49451 RepID=A0A314KZX9_NICAT|nr:hypothetical protein A4A49_06638 [Nicotiana attenuata]
MVLLHLSLCQMEARVWNTGFFQKLKAPQRGTFKKCGVKILHTISSLVRKGSFKRETKHAYASHHHHHQLKLSKELSWSSCFIFLFYKSLALEKAEQIVLRFCL